MRPAKLTFILGPILVVSCSTPVPAPSVAPSPTPEAASTTPASAVPMDNRSTVALAMEDKPSENSGGIQASGPLQVVSETPVCSRADWSPQKLPPMLTRDKGTKTALVGHSGSIRELFAEICTDSPGSIATSSLPSTVVDGVRVRVLRTFPAGKSGRGWQGSHCEFELSLADGGGVPVVLGRNEVPPFNTVRALVRSDSAVWLNLGFNGYAREFPKGGNRIVALDLCEGRVVWLSKDSASNGGLLLLGEYLITAYGFTSERRHVFVLDPHSGSVIQKLPVIENLCPSKAWAPNWRPGQRCDAPGQAVGAAERPRIEEGALMVDTNTGSSAFRFKQ